MVTASASILVFGALVCVAQPASAQFSQQGPKLVGTGAVGASQQGAPIALSADGNTLIVGGPFDNSFQGTAWVFTRSGGAWTQQAKLFGSGAVGAAFQGTSVALSADGNTALVGGPGDAGNAGAAWVFTRSGGVWSQLGSKLVGPNPVGSGARQGDSVALSADGTIGIVGGPGDNAGAGAAWVFTLSGGVTKLFGSGAVGAAAQGFSVALSADGTTAIVGGPNDNGNVGAAWVFTLSGGATKLTGADVGGAAMLGQSVALSADGSTAIVGGPNDNSFAPNAGAAWVFTRSKGNWSQQAKLTTDQDMLGSSVALSAAGNIAVVGAPIEISFQGAAWVFTRSGGVWSAPQELFGTGAAGMSSKQGQGVALSADGGTVAVGGPGDNSQAGATWVFVQPNYKTATHDFNGDGKSDILWQNASGAVALWLMNGSQVLQAGGLGTVPNIWSVIGTRDFNGDGNADLLWRDTNGNLAIWFMNGLQVSSTAGPVNVPTNWNVYGTGDLNRDGNGDLLWRDNLGNIAIWFMNGPLVASTANLGQVTTNWTINADDNKGDIFWRDTAGDFAIWQVNGSNVVQTASSGNVPNNWMFSGKGDFNADGNADVLWRDLNTGTVVIWFLNSSLGVQGVTNLGVVPLTWSIAQTGDYNGDGTSDILWIDNTGNVAVWFMNNGQIASSAFFGNVGTTWGVRGFNSE